ncbi:MAG: acetyl-CoA carboxylase carboxyltransferase subunit alpha [Anaeroplasmataceae bacterium]
MTHLDRIVEIEGLRNDINLMDKNHPDYEANLKRLEALENDDYNSLTPWDRVCMSRDRSRPKSIDYIRALFDDFIELHGDQYFADDVSIIGGIGYINGIAVTVLAQSKGKTLEENIKKNFGSNNPEGFRKTKRLALQAEKFNRPIITIVDTSGAFPGKGAEERGQARAIADNLKVFGGLGVPVIALVIGEGGSGGALALSLGNRILMLENAIYSILSPEGYASILYKDPSKAKDCAMKMKLTSYDLKELNIIDNIIIEGPKGINNRFEEIIKEIKEIITVELKKLSKLTSDEIKEERYQKYRHLGDIYL